MKNSHEIYSHEIDIQNEKLSKCHNMVTDTMCAHYHQPWINGSSMSWFHKTVVYIECEKLQNYGGQAKSRERYITLNTHVYY